MDRLVSVSFFSPLETLRATPSGLVGDEKVTQAHVNGEVAEREAEVLEVCDTAHIGQADQEPAWSPRSRTSHRRCALYAQHP